MKTAWTKGLASDEVKEITLSYGGSAVLRIRLAQLLGEKIGTADKKSYSEDGYDCPNWAYKQADLAGYKRAMKEIISLLGK